MTAPRLRIPDDLVLAEAWQQLEGEVEVEMTLTTPGCPMSESMPQAVERALLMIPGVSQVTVDLVWEPRWEPEMMTDRGKRELGWT